MRAFRPTDYNIVANEYTAHYLSDQFIGKVQMADKRVFEDGKSKAIICFIHLHENSYYGFFIVSAEFEARCVPKLKECIEQLASELEAERLETDSMDCKELNHWHKALGFELEGTKRKAYQGKDFNIWSILWERKE